MLGEGWIPNIRCQLIKCEKHGYQAVIPSANGWNLCPECAHTQGEPESARPQT